MANSSDAPHVESRFLVGVKKKIQNIFFIMGIALVNVRVSIAMEIM